jgi:hypothetical protein
MAGKAGKESKYRLHISHIDQWKLPQYFSVEVELSKLARLCQINGGNKNRIPYL